MTTTLKKLSLNKVIDALPIDCSEELTEMYVNNNSLIYGVSFSNCDIEYLSFKIEDAMLCFYHIAFENIAKNIRKKMVILTENGD